MWLIPSGAYGSIYTIDPKTGALTDTKLTPDASKLTSGLDNWGGMTYFDDTLYLINADYGGTPKEEAFIVSVDTSTGLFTELGLVVSGAVDSIASPMP